jgi:hypothetical protein
VNKVKLVLPLAADSGKGFYFDAAGSMNTIPREGEKVTILQGPQQVKEVNHCLQSGFTKIWLTHSNYWDLVHRYRALKALGWCNFGFNGSRDAIQKFVRDAEETN